MSTSKFIDNWNKIILAIRKSWAFVSEDVWKCHSNNIFIHIIKTINLSVRCFLNEMLQQRASALTYRTLLAIVPALVVLIAVGKGFGFHSIIEEQLHIAFPAHNDALKYAFTFVNSYIDQMHSGIFVGIGIILLLWTLITLMSDIENTFNDLWNVPNRKLTRRITDYMAMFILMPILLLLSNGMSIFATTLLDKIPYISSLGQHIMQLSSYVLSWGFFTLAYKLLPNAKVKIKHALISGIICGTTFNLFQWMYLSGQIWVSKYNAIYGSFAFLPLLLLWLQLSWLICLIGVVLSYSSQNVFNFDYEKDIKNISRSYYERVLITIMSIIITRRRNGQEALTCSDLSHYYMIPIQLVSRAINDLLHIELIAPTPIKNDFAYIATIDSDKLTVGELLRLIDDKGSKNFVESISNSTIENDILQQINNYCYDNADKTLVIDIPTPKEIEQTSY
ncbi:MAG: YihY/virulence factor BrkB family protein [Bacteroidaceae bacterium]|nr:YihY/virulence factor BrkB family protein [Bacteroidaceae bacterium]